MQLHPKAAAQQHDERRFAVPPRLAALAALGVLLTFNAAASLPSAAGVWRQVDESGKSGALVTISEEGNVFVGRLTHLFLDPGDNPNPICDQCAGDKHNQPILGLKFIEGMKQSGMDYDGGTILDPETGKVYSAKMRLSPDGRELTVRGYLGLSIFGKSQIWVRVENGDQDAKPAERAPQ
jgi:uncharacterized protein (DUF2147 family)